MNFRVIGLKRVLRDFIYFFELVIWQSFFLSKKDKEMIDEYNNWSYPTDKYIDEKEGKVPQYHSKTLLKISVEALQQPFHKKISRNYRTWEWFFKKNWKWFVRQTFKKHICKHKNLSEAQWNFSKMKGYRYCYKCWTDFFDDSLTFDDCNCIQELSA